ncbi:MAG: hypothetical protein ACT4NU_00635 [Chromatiales bacterium]
MTTEPPDAQPPPSEDSAQRDLVQSVELLSQLIEDKRADARLCQAAGGPADTDAYGSAALPGAEAQQSFYDLFDTPAEHVWHDEELLADSRFAPPDSEALKQEMLAELTALIDGALRRVAETARQALAHELTAAPGAQDPRAAQFQAAPLAGSPRSLAHEVGATLSRFGLADAHDCDLYSELETEVSAILTEGLEQIRRNLESAVENLLAASADARLQEPATKLPTGTSEVETPFTKGDNPEGIP